MVTDRRIKKVVKAFDTIEGGGVIVGRALPHNRIPLEDVDPFLLLDEARIDPKGPGFPEHPHRGFEIITYCLEGWGSHEDNQGNKGRIEAGGMMKLTAGSGVWHGEQGGADKPDGILHGLQFWVNLPKAQKKMKPDFQLLQKGEIPEQKGDGTLSRVLVGPGSPIEIFTPMNYLDVTVQPGKSWSWELSTDWQGYAYVLDGAGKFGAEAVDVGDAHIAVLGAGGNLRVANVGAEPLRFMLAAGLPIRENIVWNGPFVD